VEPGCARNLCRKRNTFTGTGSAGKDSADVKKKREGGWEQEKRGIDARTGYVRWVKPDENLTYTEKGGGGGGR